MTAVIERDQSGRVRAKGKSVPPTAPTAPRGRSVATDDTAVGRLERKSIGQVLVEMLLVLPIFLTLVFAIMELGNVAFQVILFNHALFETVRFGSMTVTPSSGGSPNVSKNDLDAFLKKILATARVDDAKPEFIPFEDLQAKVTNADLVVTATYPIPLIFPFSNFIMSKPPGSGHRDITLTQRMPIERPLER